MRVLTAAAVAISFLLVSGTEAKGTTADLKVLWMAEEPRCFDPSDSLPELIESIDRFVVGGPVTEPVKVSGENPTADEYAATGETPTFMIFEMVINGDGAVELVVSLGPRFQKTELMVAQYLSQWSFEPILGPDGPACIRYVLTVSICY